MKKQGETSNGGNRSNGPAPSQAVRGPDARPEPGPEEPPRLVKRYANRKLYDTASSRYITLQEIAELVKNGEDIQILDNRTKEDLTDLTLAQIIYEEQKKAGAKSVGTLRQLIQRGGEKLIGSLRTGRRESEDGELPPTPPSQKTPPSQETPPSHETQGDGTSGERTRTPPEDGDLRAEIARLQARVDELEERVQKLSVEGRVEVGPAEAPEAVANDELASSHA